MALTSAAVWQVDNGTNGSDTLNAGYFNPAQTGAGTDYSITAPIACTDLVITATNTQVTSASIGFTSAHVGDGLRITAGSGFTTGLYEITSVSGGTATLDRACGTASSTGGTARVGGAFASPGGCGAFLTSNQNPLIYVKNTGTVYSCSNTINVVAGKLRVYGAGQARVIGYQTTRTPTNTDTGPTLQPSANSVSYLCSGYNGVLIYNLICANGGSQTSCGGIALDDNAQALRCQASSLAIGFLVVGEFGSGNFPVFAGCYASGCSTAFQASTGINPRFLACVANGGGTGDHFSSTANYTTYWRCLSIQCGSGGIPFRAAVNGHHWAQCVSYKANGSAFQVGTSNLVMENCVSVLSGQGGAGYGFTGGAIGQLLMNCADYGSASGGTNLTNGQNLGFITLSSDPFNNAAGGDFSPNSVAGGGALLRAAAFPASFLGISTNNYLDIGAAQHASTASTTIISRRRKVR